MSQFEILLGLVTGFSAYDKQREKLMAESSSEELKILLSKFKSEGKENVMLTSRRLGVAFSKILRGNLFNPNKAKYSPEDITLNFEPYRIKKFSLWKYYSLISNKSGKISSKTTLSKDKSNSNVNNSNLLVKRTQKDFASQSDSTFDLSCGLENINEKKENSDEKKEYEEKKLSNELFFKSVTEGMKDLDDEEILELQIKILKALKIIQAKRKLKQDFRKYCEATSFL